MAVAEGGRGGNGGGDEKLCIEKDFRDGRGGGTSLQLLLVEEGTK